MMKKIRKFFVLSVNLCVVFSVSAGQGMYLRLESYVESAVLHLSQSECLSDVPSLVSANQTFYMETVNIGVCFFKKSTLSYDLYLNGIFSQRYDIHVSANGSKIFASSFINTNYQITSQLFPHFGLGSQDSILIHVQKYGDRWQAQSEYELIDLPINQVQMPGAHDSGSYGINHNSFLTSDAPSEYLDLASKIGFQSYIVNWAKTQNLTILEQLQLGVRYFDLRICGARFGGRPTDSKSNVYICHVLSSVLLKHVIDEVYEFLNVVGHEKEIVLLDINHLYNVTDAQIDDLTSYIVQKFGQKIASAQEFFPLTPYREFWNQNKQVILFIDDQKAQKKYPTIYWPNDRIFSPWPDTRDTSVLISEMEKNLANRIDNQFFVLQTQFTPDTNSILAAFNIFTHEPRNLYEMTGTYKLTISDWFFRKRSDFQKKGTIFIEDFVSGSL